MCYKEKSTALLANRNAGYKTIAKSETTASKAAYPYGSVGVLALGSFADSVAVGSVLTYSFAMFSDMKADLNSALYAGLLISAYASAGLCTSTFWVSQSNHYGRRFVCLLGLVSLSASSLMLGFSSNYWTALVARFSGGLFNANSALAPLIIREVLQGSEYESTASSISQNAWLIGHVFGCLVGGLSSRPADIYPAYFSQTGIFGRYPYLLPNIITTYLSVAAIIQGLFLLTETRSESVVSGEARSRAHSRGVEDDISSSDPVFSQCSTVQPPNMLIVMGQRPHFYPTGLCVVPAKSKRQSSQVGVTSKTQFTQQISPGAVVLNTPGNEPHRSKIILWTITLGLLGFSDMAWKSLLPVYMLDKSHETKADPEGEGEHVYNLLLVGTYLAVGDIMVLMLQHLIVSVPRIRGLVLLKQLIRSLLRASSSSGDSTTSVCLIAKIVAPPITGVIYGHAGSAAVWWICVLVAALAYTGLVFFHTIEQGQEHDCEKAISFIVEVEGSSRSLDADVYQV